MDRPNHFYDIRPRTSMWSDLNPIFDLANPRDGMDVAARRAQPIAASGPLSSTIVYVRTRQMADEVRCAW